MIDLKPACRQMIDLLAAVADDQLRNPTPCTGYTLGDLIKHVDELSEGFTAVAHKGGERTASAGSEFAANFAGGRRDGVARQVHALGEAWADPQAWQGSSDGAGVELSNELWGKIALTELVVHGWDIARSIGRPFDLPADTLAACLEHVAEFVPRAPIPELWGTAVQVPADASQLDRILAITGRAP